MDKIRCELPEAEVYPIVGSRSLLSKSNVVGLRQEHLIISQKVDIIWCNEPVVGIISRIANFLTFGHTKVVYFAHGLHFFAGGPLKIGVFFRLNG